VFQFDLKPSADYSPMISRTFNFEVMAASATDCYNKFFTFRLQDLGAPLGLSAGDENLGFTAVPLALNYYGGWDAGNSYACYSGGFLPTELSFFRFVLNEKCSSLTAYPSPQRGDTSKLDPNGQVFGAAYGGSYGRIEYQAASCKGSKPLPTCESGQTRVCSAPTGMLNPLSDFYNLDENENAISAKCFKGWTHNCSCVDP
jgi:hypothetical protein